MDYLKRILYILNAPLQKKIKDGFTRGWKYKASQRVICGLEIALTVPLDSSYEDAVKCLPELMATCGKEIELDNYKGTLVVRVIEKDWPHPMGFNPKHIVKDKLLMGYNRMLQPVYHPLNVHILEGGAAGSGKTDWQRWIIYQLLLQGYEVYVCDLKSFSFFPFEGLVKIATDLKESRTVLKYAANELQRRKKIVMEHRSREVIKTFRPIVIMIDEAASLAPSQYGRGTPEKEMASECDNYIALLGQQAREPKIFVIYGTQRPDMNIINRQFKANVEAAVAFRTKDHFNSQIIIDRKGAELISPKTPGRCIYASGHDVLLQVPFIGGDNEWKRLLQPLKAVLINGGSSQRANKERNYTDGSYESADSHNTTNSETVSEQRIPPETSERAAAGTGERQTGGMGMVQKSKVVAIDYKRSKTNTEPSDEI